MDADEPATNAIDQLPLLYANALRLRAAGMSHDQIAEQLDVHPEAVDTLLRLAEDKLRRLFESGTGYTSDE